jgi:hypothetical protein
MLLKSQRPGFWPWPLCEVLEISLTEYCFGSDLKLARTPLIPNHGFWLFLKKHPQVIDSEREKNYEIFREICD